MKKGLYTLFLLLGIIVDAFSQSMLISGGNDHAVALCSKGQIFAWGYNNGNRLGLKAPYSGQEFVTTPQKVDIPIGLTFSQVTAGSGSSNIALACTGVVYAWGDNAVGTAGQPITKKVIDKPMPVPCGEATDHGFDIDGVTPGQYLGGVKMVAGTTSAGIALLDDGKAVMWGGNGRWESGPTFPLFKTEVNDYPVYIKDKNGDPIENIIHISGGDNNVLLIVGDSKDASVGIAYSLGSANGRGVAASTSADPLGRTYYAAPVEILDDAAFATGTVSSTGKYLEKVKTTGISDKGGFAVDENTGYLYGWGPNGWNGCIGLEKQSDDYTYAAKVLSGEYSTISGEAYMTNVHQVIGGNGYGACVTEDHYMLYWGVHTPNQKSGGVVPNSTWANKTGFNGTVIDPGPVFANYCKGEKDPTKEVRVDDAMAIGRGDLFGFMVNMDGDFYVWGNSLAPGDDMPITGVGALGLGFVGKNDDPQGTGYRTCLSKITLDCDPQDECPKVFMIGPRYKCPGEADSLYCGFTPTTRSVRNYYFRWSLNGVVKNKSTLQEAQDVANGIASAAVKDNVTKDPWNNWIVEVKDPGKYSVEIFYVGNNVPCTNCETAEGEIEVIDMDMPIDIDTLESCVLDTLKPSSSDKIEFQAKVNDKIYKATDNVTFAVFATPTSTDTLKDIDGNSIIINTTGNGGDINFKVFGDKIDRSLGVEPRPGIDTLYHVWIEDITKFNTQLIDQTNSKSTNNGERCLILKLFSTSELTSFSVYAEGNTNNEATITITPVVYMAGKVKDGNYTLGAPLWTGDAQPFTIEKGENDGGTQITKKIECVVKCGVQLPGNPARGTEYVLSAIIKFRENGNYFLNTLPAATNMYFGTPIDDSKGYGVQAVGTFAANGTGGGYSNTDGVPFYNINFGKMTDYDCGRIPLSARYYCPPCNNPDKLEIVSTSHTIKSDVDPKYKKVVELCKESAPLDLDIEPLVGKTDPAATFDILWYDEDPQKNASATPIKSDESGTATTLPYTTDWATVAGAANITEDVEKVYYVYVHDHEKVGCSNYDSIKVIAHPVPADTLVWDTFCLTSPITEPDFTKTALGNSITWTTDPTGTFATLTDTKSFVYTVTDAVTGCISEPHTYTVTVNKTDVPQVDNAPSTTVDPTAYFDLNSTRQGPLAAGFSLRWYDDSQVLLTSSETNISRANEGSLTFYVEMYNEETQCASEKVEVVLTINDALPPDVHDESLCIDDVIDLANYVTINKKTGESDSDYELLWYTDSDAPKGTGTETSSFQTTFTATAANAGTPYEVWVSQKNVSTNAESEKKKITITVHKVATLDLTANTTTYCVYETANAFTATENNDGDFTGKKWSTSKRNDHELSSPQDNLSPTIQRGAPTAYYVLPYFENPRTYNYASDICYGTVQEINVTVNYTEIPNPEKPTVYVQYLQAQGDANGGRYNKITVQDPLSVTPDNSTDYELVWYNESGTEIPEPAPTYNATEPAGKREEKFQVAQRNKITGCISEKKDVIAVISTFPMPTTQALSFCQESDELKSSYILTADINTAGGIPATEYTLVWYKEDPEVNPGAAEYAFIDLNAENLTYNYASVLEKDTIYYVRQRHARGDSPASPLVVTIFSKPRLLTDNPDPICLGDQIDIRDYYSISNKINNKNYDNEYLSGTGGNDPIAKKHGEYRTRAYFTLSSGETCYSDWAIFNVTVNELSVKIDGEQTTCPGISKELTAVLDTNHMFTDVAKYTWNGVQSNNQTFTSPTATNGQITVTLDVEMGACRATAPAHTINVVNPGLNGDITFTERGNTKNGTKAVTQFVEFEGCGTTLNFELNVDHTEDAFTYKNLSNNNVTNSTFESGKAFLTFDGSIDAGMYEITYTNVCETSFVLNIEDRSHSLLGFATSPEVCEGDPWEITIKEDDGVKIKDFNFNPSKHTIRWKVGSTPLPQFDNSIYLKIPSTTSADNGFYSYTVTSAGCVYTENVPKNKDFISRPIVTIDSASLENNGVFEVVRGRNKDLTIPLLNPTSAADLAKLNIVWNELKGNSYEAIAGETSSTYSVSNVDEDHYYKVNFAGGKRSGDHDFCGTSIEVSLKVDAELAIKTEVVGDDRNKKTDMCIGEENVGILIDTTGTGTLLHPDKLKFRLEELIPGKEAKKLDWVEENGKLFAEINPSKSAGYRVIYEYTVGNQKKLTKDTITVHPAYEIEWDKNVRLCDGSEGFVQITKIAPSEVTVDWEDDDCLISGSNSGANVKAIYEGKDTKEFILVASNGGICDDKRIPVSVKIDKKIEGEIKAPDIVCEGNVASLTANYDADIFLWKADDDLSDGLPKIGKTAQVTSKPGYAHFIVVMQRGACSDSSDVYVEVTEKPKFEAIDSLSYKSVNIVLQGNTGTAPYKYIVDDNYEDDINSSIKVDLDYGQHKVTVIDTAGCVIDTMITINFPSFNIPIVVSPNGDNHNDAFTVPVLRDAYPDATIRIFDRWGKKLADYKAGDGIDWDGTYNGVAMPTTDYWYEIEIKEIKKTYSGHFTLIRQ
ncbi:MAG: T9SS type B sorting domain-containing protein [Paludibacteraceae bacterium]|nr:T9SS type B sorting domain-containing protein [Paludibacteraceae bacterium]